jgi:disulfide oxidoreductase YuzD
MKTKFILLFLVIFPSCSAQEKKALDSIFDQTKKIEIIAFYDRDKWEREDQSLYVNHIKNNKIEIKEKYLRNRILLKEDQIIKLKSEFGNCATDDGEIAACYMPRHVLIFINAKNEIFGYIEICFDCTNTQSSKNLEFLARCALKQEKLFKEFGITYFEDTEQEIKELKRKREEERREFDKKVKAYEEKNKTNQENKN